MARSSRVRSDRGVALAVVIATLLVLGVFATILRLLSHGAYRESDQIRSHLRAVAVGEVAFGSVVARLSAAPWVKRWFAAGPEVVRDVPAAGGSYSYLIRDSAPTAPVVDVTAPRLHRADLLVRATYERSSVVMFWRLAVPEDTLDGLSTVVPTFFQYAPPDVQPQPGAADLLSGLVDQQIQTRTQNAPGFEQLRDPLVQATTPAQVGAALGFDPGRPVLDGVPPPGGNDPPASQPIVPGPQAPAPSPFPSPPPPDPTGTWYAQEGRIRVSSGEYRTGRDIIDLRLVWNQLTGSVKWCSTDHPEEPPWTTWTFTATLTNGVARFHVGPPELQSRVTPPPEAWDDVLTVDATGDEITCAAVTSSGQSLNPVWTRDP